MLLLKPFAGKKCPTCHSAKYLRRCQLCPKCQEYSDQDYVSRREQNLPPSTVEYFQSNLVGQTKDSPWHAAERPKDLPDLKSMFRKARLTSHQRLILKMYFRDGLSFFSIAEKLRISKGSVQIQIGNALKKVKFTLTNLRRVKGKEQIKQKSEYSPLPEIATTCIPPSIAPDPEYIDPYEFYSCCPRCGHGDLRGDIDFGECQYCLWHFTVEPESKKRNPSKF
jgi:predicted DNA-binding protein YlxM (UPF0122 family)